MRPGELALRGVRNREGSEGGKPWQLKRQLTYARHFLAALMNAETIAPPFRKVFAAYHSSAPPLSRSIEGEINSILALTLALTRRHRTRGANPKALAFGRSVLLDDRSRASVEPWGFEVRMLTEDKRQVRHLRFTKNQSVENFYSAGTNPRTAQAFARSVNDPSGRLPRMSVRSRSFNNCRRSSDRLLI
jgi:hypothetical protein